ncbi:sugar ABC transporter substrate-binding protein [Streptomyces sp. MUM 203J]|uniref:sugar ABC transporter substrate-binding protein n=1 Tax=Streptomyces sp. MUM 203J TaxID=2791990 RepID=UPI001F046E62|nr:sugar ABC transporter substrate-binding protein [Streptomyces sp. MUM 203J]MCH0542828.1 sugar ABC transporter substrate-binding protein [Streptomyces sp. MUM 203J]
MARVRTGVRTAAAVLAVVLGVTLATACSATGGKRAEDARRAAAAQNGRPAVDTPRWTIAMVTHSGDGDTFWDIVQKGARQAAAKDNINFLYAHSDEGQQQAQLVDSYVDKKVDGLIVTLAKPEALKDSVARAVAAGIPVVTVNSGSEQSGAYGALTHIGQDETVAGQAVGDELDKRGHRKALCVLHEQGNVGHEQRCDGIRETFDGTLQNLYVDGTNMPDTTAAIEAKLQTDPSVDAVVTLGAPFADAAVQAKRTSGATAEIDTFDLNPKVATALENGTLGFAVDQQPYLQGYEAVDLLWLYRYNADVLGGGRPVLTGPQIITRNDADALAAYIERGTR